MPAGISYGFDDDEAAEMPGFDDDGALTQLGPLIEAIQTDDHVFAPSAEFVSHSAITDHSLYEQAAHDLTGYWAEQAQRIDWISPWTQVLDDSKAPFYQWFVDGKLNVSVNCLDRHLATKGDQVAYFWEGEPGDTESITFSDLHARVCRMANALRELGVRKGDPVAIYMGMVPELPVAMLACARIGAPHTVVFAGFSPSAIADRINDLGCTTVITQDESWRHGRSVPLKGPVDEALTTCPSVTNVVVTRRTGSPIEWVEGRDHWYHEIVASQPATCDPEPMDAEDPLFVLYTSGTTGKPKGILHTTGGYLVGVSTTHRQVFDIHSDDVYWCAADIGWITGHSYIVYGPLANGTTGIIYEGAPGTPNKDRIWSMIERYRATILYTAPTAIHAFMKWGVEQLQKHDLTSLRLLGSVGEPIKPEAWHWYYTNVGGGRCPIVDTWWQTETGMIMIAPLPGAVPLKPGSATFPLPGIRADVINEDGTSVESGQGGLLMLDGPWPAMMRTLWGDDERYVQTYWSQYPGRYLAGDGSRRDNDDYIWVVGRIDDVMNVSGHRLSTVELEAALLDHPAVAEAAVVGRADPMTGQAIAAFVTLKNSVEPSEELITELRDHVAQRIGRFARPSSIVITDELPKTGSGKIMRRLLRDISENRDLGDITTLQNSDVVADLVARSRRPTPKEDPLDAVLTWLSNPENDEAPTPARCLTCEHGADGEWTPRPVDIHVRGDNCPHCAAIAAEARAQASAG
ncbi:unannotated protein [freshwater metagenome]|uniref:acetate--CoA ligase n=1 Tax=freshwater metagenome TaxID=449393 RepID=A0A6J7P7I0_9ZZZZ